MNRFLNIAGIVNKTKGREGKSFVLLLNTTLTMQSLRQGPLQKLSPYTKGRFEEGAQV